jgi:ABC-type glycerol-3-phosphate transport system substrate-binding protein
MKKVLFASVLAIGFAACGGGASTTAPAVDSVKLQDSLKKVAADSAAKAAAMDTTKKVVDSTKKAVDSTKK